MNLIKAHSFQKKKKIDKASQKKILSTRNTEKKKKKIIFLVYFDAPVLRLIGDGENVGFASNTIQYNTIHYILIYVYVCVSFSIQLCCKLGVISEN